MDIMWESLPKGRGVDRIGKKLGISDRHLMLNGGGEYELMFTFPKDMLDRLHSSDIDVSVIGIVTSGTAVNLMVNGKSELMENRGYEHFTKD
jgi:thiamine-monophosphate kinase